jgi:Na+-transporting NADH:ubiquinone oxidoreductase subunit NqrB
MKHLDPRLYQIGALSLLLLYGLTALDFDTTWFRALLVIAAAIGAQWLCARIWSVKFDPRSAAISGLSLALLARSNSALLLLAAAAIAVSSKFIIRWRGKHIFNPTNFAIVALMIATPGVWVSPGQWGNVAFFGFLITCLGGLVVNRASRSDVTYAFIVAWSAVLIGRSLWLGEPLTIPLHRLENGALLLFTFFMISDPKTTPDSRLGRILFAVLVALGARYVQFKMFHTNGILWSLAACSLLVPVIDLLLPGGRYTWKQNGGSSWSVSQPWRWHFAPGLLPRIRSVAFTSQKATPRSSIVPRRWRSSATATAP